MTLKKINIGISQSASCLDVLSGPWNTGVRYCGFNVLKLIDVFTPNYEVVRFVDKVYNFIYNDHANTFGPARVILCVSNIPEKITPAVYATLTKKQQQASKYTNRGFPDDVPGLKKALNDIVNEINRRKCMQFISWELSQEPDAEIYSWMSFDKWLELVNIKYDILIKTGRPIYHSDFTAGLITKHNPLKSQWHNYIDGTVDFQALNLRYSTSMFLVNNKNTFDFNNNLWPKRFLDHKMVSAWNIMTGIKPNNANEALMNSKFFIIRLVETLNFLYRDAEAGNGSTDTFLIHALLACNAEVSPRGMVLWSKTEVGGFAMKKPLWDLLIEFLPIIKNGYEPTSTGLRGESKQIVIIGNSYIIKPN